MNCDLCKLEKKTSWHYEDDVVVVLDCETCRVPMIVLRRHTMTPTQKELDHMKNVIRWKFGERVKIRYEQKKIKDHLHYHIELADRI